MKFLYQIEMGLTKHFLNEIDITFITMNIGLFDVERQLDQEERQWAFAFYFHMPFK